MMKRVRSDDWVPVGGLTLEDNALKVVKSDTSKLVVAGPGAGKTELLAQRATYLLQTDTCAYPQKVLAISFKRDAAHNLKQRVRLRCGEELSTRFDSYTFDAFAKVILDNFKQALPREFKIASYNIAYNDRIVIDEYRSLNLNLVNTTAQKDLLNFHHNFSFSLNVTKKEEDLRLEVWQRLLNKAPSVLTFGMVMRAAQKIVHSNPRIKEFLQKTYAYVFLDEFQDTTSLQYSFFKTCFLSSSSIFTAVGDDKQRIMLWAGAHPAIFDKFSADTNSEIVPLTMNFRSAPRLVKLQNYLVEHLLSKREFATASPHWNEDDGEARICFYKNEQQETIDLLDQVRGWIASGVNARDICILVKQKLQVYAATIISYFNENGINARDESQLQDIVSNDVCIFIVNMLKSIDVVAEPKVKHEIISFIGNVRAESDEDLLQIEQQYSKFIKEKQKSLPGKLDEAQLHQLIEDIIALAGKEKLCASSSALRNISDIDDLLTKLKAESWKYYYLSNSLNEAMDALLGKDTIPIMTIHKSKGLEYHTIVFVGLEDNAFWSFEKQPDEDKSAFFVALSRAKERVIFTFSQKRDGKIQSFNKIEVLIETLANSGIVEINDNG